MKQKRYSFKGENFFLKSEDIKESESFEVLSRKEESWVVKFKNQIHHCEIKSFDPATKKYQIEIDHQTIEFQLMDEVDRLVEEMGMNKVVVPALDQLLAPMPGLVLNIEIKVGDEIKKDDNLIVLEAMKMENVIKASGTGTVKEILVSIGDKVEKGQLMIKF